MLYIINNYVFDDDELYICGSSHTKQIQKEESASITIHHVQARSSSLNIDNNRGTFFFLYLFCVTTSTNIEFIIIKYIIINNI